jgi:hypothetical protein
MSLLLRLSTLGLALGLLTIGQMWLPPFPPAFQQWLEIFFTRILSLDTWFPVRLTINLLVVEMGVMTAVYFWRFAKWFKAFILGEGKT